MRSWIHDSHSSSQSTSSPPSSSPSKLNGSCTVPKSSVVRSENFLCSSVLLILETGAEDPGGGPPHKIKAIASLTFPTPDCCARWETSIRHSG